MYTNREGEGHRRKVKINGDLIDNMKDGCGMMEFVKACVIGLTAAAAAGKIQRGLTSLWFAQPEHLYIGICPYAHRTVCVRACTYVCVHACVCVYACVKLMSVVKG